MKRAAICFLLVAGLALPTGPRADERILRYDSSVTIHQSGELTVTEDIRVRAEGAEIRRGIYRDFPTRYTDHFGNRYRVNFNVDAVLRDGLPESWHTEERPNGIRVYIGSPDRMLDPGTYTYQLRFRTNRQLGFFDDHDELYWNAIGNGWAFPIDAASARIFLPFTIPAAGFELSGYVGSFGSTETSVKSGSIDSRTAEFRTARPLDPYEGFTVVLTWPKGLIAEPSAIDQITWFASDNGAAIVLLTGLLVPLAWYLRSWRTVGRDPEKGVIIPRFKPPAGLSPAACRYVLDMSFGQHSFTAAIISLAVKQQLVIEEEGKEFTLRRAAGASKTKLTSGETAVLEALLPHNSPSIILDEKNHEKFQLARTSLKQSLQNEHAGRLFNLNTLYLASPLVMSGVSALIALAFNGGPAVWVSWLALSLLLHGVFIWLLRAPTPAGRLVMDEIEGFKMYLDTAEQDRLDRMRSPALTPEVFETFLPYAYALGVQNHWCERFAREMPEELRQQSGYQPGWYSGQYHGMNALNHLGDNFGSSFSAAISSASSPPGSSSGSGGGGSSGGGGGGGGGGGW